MVKKAESIGQGVSFADGVDLAVRGACPPPDVMVRVLGIMLGAGCAMAIPAVLLGSPPHSHKALAFVVVSGGFVAAVALLFWIRKGKHSLQQGTLHLTLTLTLVGIAIAAWCSNGDTTAVAALSLFALPPLFAFAFFPLRQAMPYLVTSSVLCVEIVVLTVHQTPLSCAVNAAGGIAVSALTAGYLRGQLMRSSATDSLTGLPNRQALRMLLDRESAQADRFGMALAIAVIDLDNFKEVNDNGGHRAGDELLRNVASCWRRVLRSNDELVRYGGDEFVVVLPGCDSEATVRVVDGLRRSGGHPCSIGVAQRFADEPIDATLARADAALFEAKALGRDRVIMASHGDELGPPHRLSVPLAQRMFAALRVEFSEVERSENMIRTEVLGALFVIAGLLSIPGLSLDPIPHSSAFLARVNVFAAVIFGVALILIARWQRPRLRTALVHAGLLFALVSLCGAMVSAHGDLIGIVTLEILAWVTMYVIVFLPRRVAASYCAIGAVAMVGFVLATVRSNPVGVALVELFAMVGAGLIVGYLSVLLQRQAHIDTLTQLPNRRALDGVLDGEMALAGRTGADLCLAIVDLDNLKSINDSHGHLAGDALLRDFSASWRKKLRATDVLVRFGGDEFVLLLPGCGLSEAAGRIMQLRTADAKSPTHSVGLTEWSPSDTAESFLARADVALYRAKAQGRDRVEVLDSGSAHVDASVDWTLRDQPGASSQPRDRRGLRLRANGEQESQSVAGEVAEPSA